MREKYLSIILTEELKNKRQFDLLNTIMTC